MQLNNAPSAILLLVVIGVVVAVGAAVLQQLTTTQTQGTYIQNLSYAAAGNTTLGLVAFSGYLPIIGLVIAAAIVIGLVVTAFAFNK